MKRSPKSNFPHALRATRKALGVAQEAFDQVSSRTYISALERGLKAPTLGKVEQLAEVLNVHPLTLMALSYLGPRGQASEADKLLAHVAAEVAKLTAHDAFARAEAKPGLATSK